MAGGRPYASAEYVLAHPTIELGTVVLITNPATKRSTFAEVADRMPSGTGRVAEVSAAVATALGLTERPVQLRVIDTGARGR